MHHEMSKYTLAVSLLIKYSGKLVKVCVPTVENIWKTAKFL